MVNRSDVVRRVAGGLFLFIAVGMLVAGQTVWRSRLQQQPTVFAYYWSICFVFTGLTLITALLDLRAVRVRSRREQTELVKKTWSEIASGKKVPPQTEEEE